mmetsp:Transcript_3164/g.12717  ORF Transcript_3164/g.12717 Transcript_3164/m.12717 type:complete len:290 (-) Transcript_3164:101-970(-)
MALATSTPCRSLHHVRMRQTMSRSTKLSILLHICAHVSALKHMFPRDSTALRITNLSRRRSGDTNRIDRPHCFTAPSTNSRSCRSSLFSYSRRDIGSMRSFRWLRTSLLGWSLRDDGSPRISACSQSLIPETSVSDGFSASSTMNFVRSLTLLKCSTGLSSRYSVVSFGQCSRPLSTSASAPFGPMLPKNTSSSLSSGQSRRPRSASASAPASPIALSPRKRFVRLGQKGRPWSTRISTPETWIFQEVRSRTVPPFLLTSRTSYHQDGIFPSPFGHRGPCSACGALMVP